MMTHAADLANYCLHGVNSHFFSLRIISIVANQAWSKSRPFVTCLIIL